MVLGHLGGPKASQRSLLEGGREVTVTERALKTETEIKATGTAMQAWECLDTEEGCLVSNLGALEGLRISSLLGDLSETRVFSNCRMINVCCLKTDSVE